MTRSLAVLLAAFLVLAACGGSDDDPAAIATTTSTTSTTTEASPIRGSDEATTDPSALAPNNDQAAVCGSGGERGEPSDVRTFTTTTGDVRTYLLDLPSGYDEGAPADVVFNFHGRGSQAIEQYVYGSFTEQAERDGVILVTPDSRVVGDAMQWSPGTAGSGDDLDFVDELVDEIRAKFCTDRFFAAGMSSGGLMTTALACQADSDFEAFGPVTLWFYNEDCEDAPQRPIIEFHGTDDFVVSFDGGNGDSVIDTGIEWAAHNGCDPEPIVERITDGVDHHTWNNCDAQTEHYVINGGGHSWPGSFEVAGLGSVTDEVSASDIIWDLFFGSSSD